MHELGILKCGVPSKEELAGAPGRPSEERMRRGAVAVIECIQEIPCNPCEAACPHKAIYVGQNITKRPTLNEDLCVGCGLCIARCPGLAIFVIDMAYDKELCTIDFPFEYVPLPEKGSEVDAVDRYGQIVCKGKVLKVSNSQMNQATAVVRIEIPQKYADIVRSIKRRTKQNV